MFGAVEPSLATVIAHYEAADEEFPIEPYPETRRVLRCLRERVAIGIVTSAGRALAVRQLERVGLHPSELSVFQAADDTTLHKPDPGVFNPALDVLAAKNIPRGAVLYVGDSLRDFQAARGAGLEFCGVLRGTTTAAEFTAAGAHYCENLEPLLDRIKTVSSRGSSQRPRLASRAAVPSPG